MNWTWSDIGDIVGKAAPTLGTALAGKAGGAVGAALADLLGADSTPESVKSAIDSNPEWHLKARELELEMQKAVLADRDSARGLQKAALAAGKGEFQNWLAAGVLVGGIIMLGCIAFMPADGLTDNTRMYILGFLTAAMTQVLNYFFGSTQWGNRNAKLTAESPSANLYSQIGVRG
ncbi:hypothetical protein F0A16_02805 [Salinicola corii]|uniref:Holin of 3TMs, for gene-transfer release n=1 Tax=Salinicola corii TaxID=2606937 RepID=A0A640WJI4_9GAMM|nr:hypothetical protein [Salinicola corii]KAA0020735.1 hypothetical protein F0A16_02805 [Salinicola corii]